MESGTSTNPLADMPQAVRIERAKVLIAQAVTGTAMSYSLTLPETTGAVESVLSDLRSNMLSYVSSQYQSEAAPQPTMSEVPKTETKTA